MLNKILSGMIPGNIILVLTAGAAFAATYVLLAKPFAFLPRDGGKFIIDKDGNRQAVNENSSGKATGTGLIFISVYLLCMLLFLPLSMELVIYSVFSMIMMMTGYLDDASKSPWGELVKGILDLALSVVAVVVYILYHGTNVVVFGNVIHIPVVLYAILGTMLIWASINVTNCSDGVDGLCGTVSVIELFSIFIIFGAGIQKYAGMSIVLAFVISAYLAYNWYPSTVLMGDAGSRTIGYTIALLCMLSGHPFIFLLLSLVFIFDGGVGLLKLAVKRLFKISFLDNIRFPFHDELRKNHNWSVKKVVIFFSICEIILCVISFVLVRVF